MSLTGIATAEHPENVAALDDQFAVSPQEVNHEDIWPLEATGAGKKQGDIGKDSQANSTEAADRVKARGLVSVHDNLSPGKVMHGTSSA